MPAATRLGDNCTGHGCYPPRPSISGSPNVNVNGRPAVRVSDTYQTHSCTGSHKGLLASGAPNVNINGLAAGRVGDAVDCGSKAGVGSPNVFIGNR